MKLSTMLMKNETQGVGRVHLVRVS